MKERNKRRIKIGSIVVGVFLLAYIPSLLYWAKGQSIGVEILRIGTLENSVSTKAWLVRGEQVFRSEFEGKFVAEVNEGEKVPAGYCIATALDEASIGLLEELNEKRNTMIKAFNAKKENQELFTEDLRKLDTLISNKVSLLIEKNSSGSFTDLRRLKSEINELMDKRADIMGGLPTADAHINMLKKEEEELRHRLASNTNKVITASPGIVSYKIDGLEEVLTPTAIRQLTPAALEGIKSENTVGDTQGIDVTAGKPFVKTIDPTRCYLVAVLEGKDHELFRQGDKVKIRINDINREFSTLVDFKSEDMGGKYIFSFIMDRNISETAGYRNLSIDIVKNSVEGLKVPLSSLTDVNAAEGTAKIVLAKANSAKIIDVKIKLMDDEYAIIESRDNVKSGISLYDMYVISPENIKEGQVINQ